MNKLPKIIPIIIGAIIIFLLILIFSKQLTGVFIRAENITPVDVNASEITENSAKIIWTTGQENQGVIEYGISPTDLNYIAPELNRSTSHSVDLTLLVPNTTYYFQIKIGENKFDNSGVPWTFSTKGSEDSTSVVPNSTEKSGIKLPQKTGSTPISSMRVEIPDESSPVVCNETDCQKIKAKLGKECSTVDYMKCLQKLK